MSLVPFDCITFSNDSGKRMITYSTPEKALEELSTNPEKYCAALVNKLDNRLAIELTKIKKLNSHLQIVLVTDTKTTPELQNPVDKVVPVYTRKEQLFETVIELYNSTESSKKRLLLEKLESLGAQQNAFKNLSTVQLEGLVTSLSDLIFRNSVKTGRFKLSLADKKILKHIVISKGRVSSFFLSKELDIPLTTVRRHRKILEKEFLEYSYNLKITKFNLRKADVFIRVEYGNIDKIGEKLLELNQVVKVTRSMGTNNIDLHAEIIFKENLELSKSIEKIKEIGGVVEVMWIENIQQMGTNDLPFLQILEG